MLVLTYMILSILFLSTILMLISISISKKSKNKMEKFTPFECGFNFFNYSRMPFSMRFFLISIIFIIFDVEISIILPMILTIMKSNIVKWSLSINLFLIILLLGVMLEWKEMTFQWK